MWLSFCIIIIIGRNKNSCPNESGEYKHIKLLLDIDYCVHFTVKKKEEEEK